MTPSPKTPEPTSTAEDKLAREVGERVKQARGRMTQEGLAEATGISQSVISKIEDGKKKRVDASQLQLIAEATGTSVAWLLGQAPGSVAVPKVDSEGTSEPRRKVAADGITLDDYLSRHPELPDAIKWALRENRHYRPFPFKSITDRTWERLARIAQEELDEALGHGGAPGSGPKRKG